MSQSCKLDPVLTLGIMGGVKVPFLKPSQLKPSNHLGKEKKKRQLVKVIFLQLKLHCNKRDRKELGKHFPRDKNVFSLIANFSAQGF